MDTTHSTHRPPSLATTWKRMQLASGTQAPRLRQSMLCSVLSSTAQGLAFACFYPLLAASLETPQNTERLVFWGTVLALLTLADGLLNWKSKSFDYSEILAKVTHDLRVDLGNQLRRMPLEILYRRRTGDLSAVLAGNVDEVVTPMGMISSAFIGCLVPPAVTMLATLFVDWRLALAMACIFPCAIPLYYWRRRSSSRSMRLLADAHARTSSELLEYAQGLAVLRATNQVGAKAVRLQEAIRNLQMVQKKEQLRVIWPGLAYSSVVQIGLVLVLTLGVWFLLAGSLDLAVLAALLVVVVRFIEPLALVFGISPVFDYMEAGFERVEALLAVKPLPVAMPSGDATAFDLVFENVTFGYAESARTVLHDVSFSLPERSLTALVGPSGSGKTTVTRMIMRYADPLSGQVRIGGVDVRAMEPEDLMRHVSVVFQDVYLFDDTIFANIRMGRPGATDEEVERAARAAYCHEFISRLPQGYQTRVGDIGGCLSGGERQRISIARAILKDAPIVILDEPTAALDTESEVAVQQAIDALVRDRTVIVIAHRLSTVVGADAVLVFEDGRIVEKGTHSELLTAQGRYRAMWDAQQATKNLHGA